LPAVVALPVKTLLVDALGQLTPFAKHLGALPIVVHVLPVILLVALYVMLDIFSIVRARLVLLA